MDKTTICNFTTRTFDNTSIPKSDVNHILFFDTKTSRVFAVNAVDYREGNFDRCLTIKKAADLSKLGRIYFANLGDFVAKYPDSHIERYISDVHSKTVLDNFDKYIAAYVHLYRCYKSLAALAENSYGAFIDAFFEACCNENTDHPATICYFGNEIHKILKLRKAVFNMFDKELNDYSFYTQIFVLQNVLGLKDNELRKLRKKTLQEISAFRYALTRRIDGESNSFAKVNKKAIFEELIAA